MAELGTALLLMARESTNWAWRRLVLAEVVRDVVEKQRHLLAAAGRSGGASPTRT